jgi:hypothetical protein
VFGEGLRQKLKRDNPVQVSVLSLVYHAQAASTELLEDLIMGDGFAGHRGKCRRRRS